MPHLSLVKLGLGLFLLVAVFIATASIAVAAELTDVEGSVLVERGDGRFKIYQTGMVLNEGDRILVLDGAQATLLNGSCSVPLATNSTHVVGQPACASAPTGATLVTATPVVTSASSDTAAVSGRLWNDLNGDLSKSADEPMMGGVKIALVNRNCKIGIDCPIATSDIHGNFGFAALEPGTYEVGIVDDNDDFKAIGVLVLGAGTTTPILIASSKAEFVLITSSTKVAAFWPWGGAAIAAAAVLAITTGDDSSRPDRPPVSP